MKAFWGLQDISTRTSFPEDIFSFALPSSFFAKIGELMKDSFIFTERWVKVLNRIKADSAL